MIARQLHLNRHRDGNADKVTQLDALRTLGQTEIPDRIGQRGGGAVGGDEVIDAARSREMALEHLTCGGRIHKLSDGDVQPYGKDPCRCASFLFLLAELKRAVVVDFKFLLDDVDGSAVFQQSGELFSLKRHCIRSFPSQQDNKGIAEFISASPSRTAKSISHFDFRIGSGYNNNR